MANRPSVSSAVAIVGFSLVLAGCGGATDPTVAETTTAGSSATSEALAITTTSTAEGPQSVVSGGLLEPGEYITTLFEPTVVYRIEHEHVLRVFQSEHVTGLHSRRGFLMGAGSNIGKYRGVAIHNVWLGLTQVEVLAKLQELEGVELGPTTAVELAGFRGVQTETSVAGNAVLWDQRGASHFSEWVLESNQVVRLIILDTPAGTMLITIGADAEEWDDFLPTAEEILAGISFPDL